MCAVCTTLTTKTHRLHNVLEFTTWLVDNILMGATNNLNNISAQKTLSNHRKTLNNGITSVAQY